MQLSSETQPRRHVRRRTATHAKEAEESHVKRVKKRKSKKRTVNECTGHLTPPPPPQSTCIIM